MKKDLTQLDEIVIGRVEPHIYAFSTNTIPNYLKIGDTYRPVNVRLEEWKKKYANLKYEFDDVAKVDEGIFFRDYSVHQFLEQNLNKQRLRQNDISDEVYYSNEFFKETSPKDVMAAISSIKDDYKNNLMQYQFYDEDRLPAKTKYKSTGVWKPRPNQQRVIDSFRKAYENGRTNLLLYAVMRFGKTFTSMCCANEMDARVVLIVSAKKDVKEEWRKTIESAENFSEFIFATSNDLNSNPALIKDTKKAGKRIAIFATLQELTGNSIKEKHKELFSGIIDLLLVDETHFGARAEEYGKVLRDVNEKVEDYVDSEEANRQIKRIESKVRIHLSGTPYRILMSSEFEKEDIIGFYQASDISDEQKAWDDKHLSNEEFEEWDNPYFGHPQMIRFAFTPNKTMRTRMESLRKQGDSYGLSELFRPLSIRADKNEDYKRFKYENEVFELLRVIDGSEEDDGLLGLLDYDKIKTGELCHHIVMVLPFCASCDAMEQLIKENANHFRNLCEYEIINISGINNKYTIPEIKKTIKQAENNRKKTITLTVNRMLTGSTVEEWDTMIYLKDSSSPQEYDQAIFRLQNQFVVQLNSGDGKIIKYNKKPQTLLVDLDPNRVFRMQEERSLIYNASVNKKGRDNLEAQIKKDINYSPIVVLNKNAVHRVNAPELMSAIDNYSRERGIYDEAQEIPVDLNLLNYDDIRREIERQGEFKGRNGFELTYGETDEIDLPEDNKKTEDSKKHNSTESSSEEDAINNKNLEKQFRTYYSRILFYSALTDNNVKSLDDVISSLDSNKNNERIAGHLSLKPHVLEQIREHIDFFTLNKLDNTISRINKLSNDDSLSELERAHTAISKFDRLSDSEVITPQRLCDEIIDMIGARNVVKIIKKKGLILDIASKEAEFALAIVNALQKCGISEKKYKDSIFSIPTSGIAYEFTRKIYSIIGLNIDNIAQNNTSYDLITLKTSGIDKKEFIKEIFGKRKTDDMNFEAIVGNPPYQENVGGKTNKSLSKQLFPSFVQTSIELKPRYVSLITPSRWFTGEGQDGSFPKLRKFIKENNHIKKLVNFDSDNKLFKDISVGSVNYYLYDSKYSGDTEFWEVSNNGKNCVLRPLFEDGMEEVLPLNYMTTFIKKIKNNGEYYSLTKIISGRNPFGIPATNSELKKISLPTQDSLHNTKTRCAYGEVVFIPCESVKRRIDEIDKYKVFLSKMNGGAGTLSESRKVSIIGPSYFGDKGDICSNALISVGPFNTRLEATNAQKYLMTKFLRFLVGFKKSSQVLTRNVYQFVPIQDFTKHSDIDWSKSIGEIDAQLYKKYNFSKEEIQLIEDKIKPIEKEEI